MRSRIGPWVAAGAFAVLTGCAAMRPTTLYPAPGARVPPERPSTAFAEGHGVRLWAEGNAWSGYPRDLARVLTPLRVYVENAGDRPVRVRYESFALVTPSGFRKQPIPPFQISTSYSETGSTRLASIGPTVPASGRVQVRAGIVVQPRFHHRHFHIAPHHQHYYHPHAGFSVWSYGFPYDRGYHDHYYDRWRRQLPTRDMLSRALPEGVIRPEGQVSGFLYFPEIEQQRGAVSFEMELVAAKSGERLGKLVIPFQVR